MMINANRNLPFRTGFALLSLSSLLLTVPVAAQTPPAAQPASGPAPSASSSAVPPKPAVNAAGNANSPKPLNQLTTAAPAAKSAVRPWAVGVAPEAQDRAKQLFTEGTDYLLRSLEEQAIEKYNEALKHWNHPGIHYNYAVALSTQDRAIETREHLLEALRYGADGPLDKLEVEQARRYLTLVEASLALVDIQSNQPGVVVSLNGEQVFTGPGRHYKFVDPDEYLVSATKPGYIPQERRLAFLPGKENKVELRLYSEQELTRYKRRWAMWGPVTVTSVGALAAIGGGAAWFIANNKYDDYDSKVASGCPAGCAADDPVLTSLQSTKDSADTYNAFAMPLMIGGGVGLAAGVVLLYLNRAEAYQISPSEAGITDQVSFTPVVGPRGAELITRVQF